MSFVVAVGGATGNVGREMLRILEQRQFPIASLVPLATKESATAGRAIEFRGERLPVRDLATHDFSGTDLLFMSTGAANSREASPRAAARGCVVIDNSSAFRMDPEVPLIVPEVNGGALAKPGALAKRILPVANCSTIQLVMALKPLHDGARIKRVVVNTYQSASGGGRRLLERLKREADSSDAGIRALSERAKAASSEGGDKPIAFNVVPHIDVFLKDGRTKEEWKMEVETRKILGEESLPVCATCVRVPVMVGHAEAVHVEFEQPLSVAGACERLAAFPGIRIVDSRTLGAYATPLDCAGEDAVFISRIRQDKSVPNGLSLWIVADNIRKGAALNAVQIGEELVRRGLVVPRR
ncbi:MAG: aspartate-semialdehyde dehydrogenase [Propionivibrio sp.]